jgi:hypothetical protein
MVDKLEALKTIGAILLVLFAGVFLLYLAENMAERNRLKRAAEFAESKETVVRILERGPQFFKLIDTDGDDLMMQEELRNAVLGGELTGVDLEQAKFLYSNLRKIGHVLGTYAQGKFSIAVYVISILDLKLYIQRSCDVNTSRCSPTHY